MGWTRTRTQRPSILATTVHQEVRSMASPTTEMVHKSVSRRRAGFDSQTGQAVHPLFVLVRRTPARIPRQPALGFLLRVQRGTSGPSDWLPKLPEPSSHSRDRPSPEREGVVPDTVELSGGAVGAISAAAPILLLSVDGQRGKAGLFFARYSSLVDRAAPRDMQRIRESHGPRLVVHGSWLLTQPHLSRPHSSLAASWEL